MAQNTTKIYGLLGQTLKHSWSDVIHKELGSYPYSYFEKEPHEVEDFITHGNWDGINVTIPYKRAAYECADKADELACRLGVANTLVKRDGCVYAYNTDVYGFSWLLEHFCTTQLKSSVEDVIAQRDVLVLGAGGASQAVRCALRAYNACIHVVDREGELTYQTMYERVPNAVLIVGATPVGMYPNCPASLIDTGGLAKFSQLKGVIDVVYNPSITGICLNAERLHIPYQTGLPMLVAQAAKSSEYFQNTHIDTKVITRISTKLMHQQKNIAFIGMPGVGKTSCARCISTSTGREFVDLDEEFERHYHTRPADFLKSFGEQAFREKESKLLETYGKQSGLIISCGGGIVCRDSNYQYLHQNSVIVYLTRPLTSLSVKDRPLSQAKGLQQLYEERKEAYERWADVVHNCLGSAQKDAQALISRLDIA